MVAFLSIIGVLYTLHLLYRFASFLSLYFVNSYPLDDYLTGDVPYALVTGASDGIGKAIATELCLRGFNLILHGRNAEKIRQAADEIHALSRSNGQDRRDIRIFLADATNSDQDFQNILGPFKDLNISILVNNVGGGVFGFVRIDEWSTTEILKTINLGIVFPLRLIHALMPQFRKRAGKCLIVNVGSTTADIPPPRVAICSSVKSFMRALTWGLSVDERYFTRTNVGLIYLNIAQVQSNALRKPVTFFRPSSEYFAKAAVNRIACGRLEVTPYASHSIIQWLMLSMGKSVGEWLLAQQMRSLFFLKDEKSS